MKYATVGERFGGEVVLSRAEIGEFARMSGDLNPLHHDEEAARRTRFGGVIASGPHTAAHFMGITATFFSRRGAALGLEFSIRFRKAARPDEPLKIEWTVVGVEHSQKLGGELVRLEGAMTNPKGEAVLSGSGTLLVTSGL